MKQSLLVCALVAICFIVTIEGKSGFSLVPRTIDPTTTSNSFVTLSKRGGGKRIQNKNKNDSISKEKGQGPLQMFVNTVKESRRHLVAAAAARSVSIFVMFPIDTIKTRIQMELPNPFRLEGSFNGVGGSLIGQVPYGVLTFGSYELYKKTFLNKFPNTKPVLLYALAAICGDVTGSGWVCPSEVVKQKTQAGMYASTGDAIRSIWASKGFGGFYEGYFGGLARDIPFRVAQLTSYEVAKNFYLRIKKKNYAKNNMEEADLTLSPIETATCGAIAGTFSAGITAPLDRIKTLLMTDSAAYGGSVASCLSKIWKEEGVAGLCQGLVPRVTYIAPSVVVFFIVYEQVQQRLADPAI